MMAYRSTPHSSTGYTPNQMVLGKNIVLPSQLVTGMTKGSELRADNYVAQNIEKMSQIHDKARACLKKNAKYRKKYYDRNAKARSFASGDKVWMHDPTKKISVCSKLSKKWLGPYQVIKKVDDLIYMIKTGLSKLPKAVHVDRLLPYNGSKKPRWMTN